MTHLIAYRDCVALLTSAAVRGDVLALAYDQFSEDCGGVSRVMLRLLGGVAR